MEFVLEIRMAINPSYAVVVRGDKSSKPWFLCVAVGYPTPTIEWSGISSLYDANQVPVSIKFSVDCIRDGPHFWPFTEYTRGEG